MTQQAEQEQSAKDLVIRNIRLFVDVFNAYASGEPKVICLNNLTLQMDILRQKFNMSSDEIGKTLGLTDSLVNNAYFHSALVAAHQVLEQANIDITDPRNVEFDSEIRNIVASNLQAAAEHLETARRHAPDPETYDKIYANFGTTPDELRDMAREVEKNENAYIAPKTTILRMALGGAPKIFVPEPTR